MYKFIALVLSLFFFLCSDPASARGRSSHSSRSHSYSSKKSYSPRTRSYTHSRSYKPRSTYKSYSPKIRSSSLSTKRDRHGRIVRSQTAKNQFKKSHPCPSTGRSSGACPGYVVDHVKALKRGGADAPSNMQWQTIQDAKAKDKWE